MQKVMNKKVNILQGDYLLNQQQKISVTKNNTKINAIQEKIQQYQQKINKQKSLISELENEYKEKEKLLKKLQKDKQKQQKQQSNLKTKIQGQDQKKLENELEKKLKTISNYKSKNNQLRNVIENLRKEKIIYQNIYTSIQKEVSAYEKQLQESSKKLESLENFKMSIKQKLSKKEKENNLEKELTKIGYMTIKKQLEKSSLNMFQQEINNLDSQQLMPDQQDSQILRKSNLDSKEFEIEEKQIQNEIEEIDNLFSILYKETNTQDVDSLIKYYSYLEEENSQQYNETQQLIEEIDKLKDKKLSMQIELKNFISNNEQQKSVKEDIVQDMQKDLKQLTKKLQSIHNSKKELKVIVNSLKLSLPVILDRLNFDNKLNLDTNVQIENNKVSEYLYQLEKQTNRILKLVQVNGLKSRIFDEEIESSNNLQKKQDDQKSSKIQQQNLEELKKTFLSDKKDIDNHQILTKQYLINNVEKDIQEFFKKSQN